MSQLDSYGTNIYILAFLKADTVIVNHGLSLNRKWLSKGVVTDITSAHFLHKLKCLVLTECYL